MSKRKYIDFKLIEKVPNKYNIKPEDIKKLKVLDWDKLKKKTWYNDAMKKTGEWYCHLEGSNGGGFYGDDEDEFWIGFNKKNNFGTDDGVYIELFAIKNGIRYNAKIINMKDMANILTNSLMDGIENLCK